MKLNEIIDSHKEEMFETLKELIRIPSVQGEPKEGAPYGENVQKALNYMLEKAKSMGFDTCDFDHQVGYCEYGSGDIIAVVAHLDVVPAGEGWKRDPFGGESENGFIYGRGAVDDKGPAVASLYALYALKEAGVKLNKKIRIMFGTNEETGSKDMEYFFSHGGEEPLMGFTPDGAYPLIYGEKGIVIDNVMLSYDQSGAVSKLISIKGGTAHNVVPEKATALVKCPDEIYEKIKNYENKKIKISKNGEITTIETFGIGAHGSTPEKGENAIGILLEILSKIPLEKHLFDAINFLNDRIGMETNGKKLGIYLHDEISGDLTLNMGTIEGNDEKLSIGINYRYPVTKKMEDCVPAFDKAFKEAGFTLTDRLHEPALYVDLNCKLIKTLLSVYENQTGLKGEPMCIGGGTYAKSVKNTVAFGPVFPGEPDREHKPDECIEEANILVNCKIFSHAMYELSK